MQVFALRRRRLNLPCGLACGLGPALPCMPALLAPDCEASRWTAQRSQRAARHLAPQARMIDFPRRRCCAGLASRDWWRTAPWIRSERGLTSREASAPHQKWRKDLPGTLQRITADAAGFSCCRGARFAPPPRQQTIRQQPPHLHGMTASGSPSHGREPAHQRVATAWESRTAAPSAAAAAAAASSFRTRFPTVTGSRRDARDRPPAQNMVYRAASRCTLQAARCLGTTFDHDADSNGRLGQQRMLQTAQGPQAASWHPQRGRCTARGALGATRI